MWIEQLRTAAASCVLGAPTGSAAATKCSAGTYSALDEASVLPMEWHRCMDTTAPNNTHYRCLARCHIGFHHRRHYIDTCTPTLLHSDSKAPDFRAVIKNGTRDYHYRNLALFRRACRARRPSTQAKIHLRHKYCHRPRPRTHPCNSGLPRQQTKPVWLETTTDLW